MKETIFTGMLSGKELHCRIDDRNWVFWKEVPEGENGRSVVPFKTYEEAERFIVRYARVLGYLRREAE